MTDQQKKVLYKRHLLKDSVYYQNSKLKRKEKKTCSTNKYKKCKYASKYYNNLVFLAKVKDKAILKSSQLYDRTSELLYYPFFLKKEVI